MQYLLCIDTDVPEFWENYSIMIDQVETQLPYVIVNK